MLLQTWLVLFSVSQSPCFTDCLGPLSLSWHNSVSQTPCFTIWDENTKTLLTALCFHFIVAKRKKQFHCVSVWSVYIWSNWMISCEFFSFFVVFCLFTLFHCTCAMWRCVILWWSVAVVFWLFMTASLLENVFLVIILAFHAMLNIMVIDCIPSWSFYPIVIILSHHDHCIPSWPLHPIMIILSHLDLCIISWPLHPIKIVLYITSWLLHCIPLWPFHPIVVITSHCDNWIPP